MENLYVKCWWNWHHGCKVCSVIKVASKQTQICVNVASWRYLRRYSKMKSNQVSFVEKNPLKKRKYYFCIFMTKVWFTQPFAFILRLQVRKWLIKGLTRFQIKENVLGWNSQNLIRKFVRFFVSLGLKCWDFLGYKYFLKQIWLKGDVNHCINHKVPIFYE